MKQDKARIENVQRRATKLLASCSNKEYHDRLKATKLFSMDKRRTRGDHIETYKIFNELTKIDVEDVFILNNNDLRSNGKLKKDSFTLENYKEFFNKRVVEPWNLFIPPVVGALW